MKTDPSSSKPTPAARKAVKSSWGTVSIYLMAFAACGWLVLLGNLFPIARLSSHIVPVVQDIPGLTFSTLLLLIIALTPTAIRGLLGSGSRK